jgi:tRNA (guanine37-N1)-methyltransferase
MDFTVLTIFPAMFEGFCAHGIVRRAIASGAIRLTAIDIREHAAGRHRVTDGRPFGGGCGMVMKPEPLMSAIRAARAATPAARTLMLSPQGRRFDQGLAEALSGEAGIIMVCGRYEGVDARVEQAVDLELSIGDYVLSGGETAAMVVIDAVTRLLPGVLGGEQSASLDSFGGHLLEHEHYTRPPLFEGQAVPEVLLSGNHGRIERWRRETALVRTLLKRPELLGGRPLEPEQRGWLQRQRDLIDALLADTPEAQQAGCGTSPAAAQTDGI